MSGWETRNRPPLSPCYPNQPQSHNRCDGFPAGRGLNDSPVGLAAYILEKFSTWTSPDFRNLEDGGLTRSVKSFSMTSGVRRPYQTAHVNMQSSEA